MTIKIFEKNQRKPFIIFVTTEDFVAYKGYGYGAFDVIIKSSIEMIQFRLEFVVSRVTKYVKQFQTVEFNAPYGKKYFTPIEIQFVKHDKNENIFVLTDKSEVSFRQKLAEAFVVLKDYDFVQVNKSCIVNLRHVNKAGFSTGSVLLNSGVKIPIGRKYKENFEEQFIQFLRR